MFDLFQTTARYVTASFPTLLLASLAIATLETFGSTGAAVGAGLVVQVQLIWLFHGHFLYADPPLSLVQSFAFIRPSGRFLCVMLLLTVLPFVIALPPALAIGIQAHQSLALLGLVSITYLIVLGLFGTALPASIDRDPRYSLTRAMRQLTRMLGLLLAGLVPLFVASGIALTALAIIVPDSPALQIAQSTLSTLVSHIGAALTAAILCKVYRETFTHTAPST